MDLITPMLEFFGLREQPFAATADPRFFYATREYKECLFRIWSAIEGGDGPVIVLGRAGMGKTLLMRKVLADLAGDPTRFATAVIASPSPSWTGFQLLESLLDRFLLHCSRPSYDEYMETLNRYLEEEPDRVNTLCIDDAQNLRKPGTLEVLRLTQNLETPQRKLLNLVLFGQLEWAETLREAPSLVQRATVVYVLPAWSFEDVRHLVEFRLGQAGAADGGPRFSAEGLRLAHEFAEGVPRVVVGLCRNALAVAARLGQRDIGKEIILYTIDKTTMPEVAWAGEDPSPSPTAAPPEPAPETGAPGTRSLPTRALEERANELLLRAARQRPVE